MLLQLPSDSILSDSGMQNTLLCGNAFIPPRIFDIVVRKRIDFLQKLLFHITPFQRIDSGQIRFADLSVNRRNLLHPLYKPADIILAGIDFDDFLIQPGQLIDSFKGSPAGCLNGKDNIAGHFNKLSARLRMMLQICLSAENRDLPSIQAQFRADFSALPVRPTGGKTEKDS